MSNFTAQITDSNVISELPDVSILGGLYDDTATPSSMASSFNSVSIRKKFQALLGFKLSEESKTSLYESLKQSYIDYETNLGNDVSVEGDAIFVNNRLVAIYIDGFADGLFTDQTFADAFFSTEVMDVIFTSNDESFIEALISVGNFWDTLFSYPDTLSHIETNYFSQLKNAYKTSEVAYVKYVTKKASLTTGKYKDIKFLSEDAVAMEAISSTPDAYTIERDSKFGIQSRLMFMFNDNDIENIANLDDNIDRLENDASLRMVVVDFDAVQALPVDSKMRKYVIDNDGRFGAIISEKLNLETAVSLSNILYDSSLKSAKESFVKDNSLVDLMFESELYNVFYDVFYDAFMSVSTVNQRFAFNVDLANSVATAFYTTRTFGVKSLSVSLSGITETTSGVVSSIDSPQVITVPYGFNGSDFMGVKVDRDIYFNNSSSYNLYDEFVGGKFSSVIGASGHIVGIQTDGKFVSSKFLANLNLSTETVQNIMVTSESVIIKTAETMHGFGNLGEDTAAVVNSLIVNKDSIIKATMFNDKVIALLDTGSVSIVDEDGIQDEIISETADIIVVQEKLIVLKSDGSLVEVKADGTVSDIATDVSTLEYAQDAVIVKIGGNDRAVFNSGDQWVVYDFNVNAL